MKSTVNAIISKLPMSGNSTRIALVHYSHNDERTNVAYSLGSAQTLSALKSVLKYMRYEDLVSNQVDIAR